MFQSRTFAVGWCDIYRAYAPVLLGARSSDGRLRGLLCLAEDTKTGTVVPVGGRDAEYQGWLALPDDAELFPRLALSELGRRRPHADVVFRYLPPATPVDWLRRDNDGPALQIEFWARPLMSTAEASRSLRKKSNRSRLNRLKALGELRFERLTDAGTLDAVIDEIGRMYDLRQGAAHGAFPFSQDPNKRRLLVRLLQDGVLHATVLRSGDALLAAHLGAMGEGAAHLGVIAHSPFHAAHSPGKLHMLLLAQMLAEEERPTLDLTPGGDPYKERFADRHDQVCLLRVFGHRRRYWARRAVETAEAAVRRVSRAAGVEPKTVKAAWRRLRRTNLGRAPIVLLRNSRDKLYRDSEYRVYSYALAARETPAPTVTLARDSLPDLLRYVPAEAWQSKEAFLARALARLEHGEHVYTFSDDERLLHYGWLNERAETMFATEVRQGFRFPERSACLYEFYTFPHARGRGLYQQSLRRMLGDLAAGGDVDRAFIGVLADNGPSRHVIEKTGFQYECSGIERIRFGRAGRWMTASTTTSVEAAGAE